MHAKVVNLSTSLAQLAVICLLREEDDRSALAYLANLALVRSRSPMPWHAGHASIPLWETA